MKRSAAVAGVLEIGQGVCKLKLKNPTFQSEAASSSNTSTSQSPTSSSITNAPDVANVIAQTKSGDLVTRASEKTITSQQIQSHVCYIQRTLNFVTTLSFVTGIKSGWSEQAQEAFQTWLAAPKKRFTTLTTMQALTNGEVEAEGSADTMNSRQPLATPFRVQNNTALSHQDLADEITPVGPITTNDTPPSTRTHTTSTSRRVMSPIRTTRPPPTRTQTTSTSCRVMSPIQARIRRPEAVLRLWQFRTFRHGPLSGTMCGTRVSTFSRRLIRMARRKLLPRFLKNMLMCRAYLGGMPFMPSACDQAKRGLLANSVCKLLHVMLEDFTCTTQVYSVTELSSA